MWTLSTLGSYRDHGYGLTLLCLDCRHFGPANIPALIERFGADFDTVDEGDRLLSSLKCSKCGSKRMEVRVSAPTGVMDPGRAAP